MLQGKRHDLAPVLKIKQGVLIEITRLVDAASTELDIQRVRVMET